MNRAQREVLEGLIEQSETSTEIFKVLIEINDHLEERIRKLELVVRTLGEIHP